MALHNALHRRYVVYELKERKNICIIGNVITIQDNSEKKNCGI